MSSSNRWDWKRKAEGVQWPDIWEWLAQIRDDYGLWGQVTLIPPLPCRAGKEWGQIVLTLRRHHDGGMVEVITRYQQLPRPDRARAEDVALQMVAAVEKQLDGEAWAAERAAGEGGLPM